jgi:hypothetical protein
VAFRKFPPLTRPTRKIQTLTSQGSVVVTMTVIPRRRLGLQIETSHVRQLGAFFDVGAAAAASAARLSSINQAVHRASYW